MNCVNYIVWYRCYDIVYISKINWKLEGEGGYAMGLKIIHDDINSNGGEWRAHGETRSLFVGDALEIEGRVSWTSTKAFFKLMPRHFCMWLNLMLPTFNTRHGDANLDVCEQWNCIEWDNFVTWGNCDVFNLLDEFKTVFLCVKSDGLYCWSGFCCRKMPDCMLNCHRKKQWVLGGCWVCGFLAGHKI